jgi:hypothetical protein
MALVVSKWQLRAAHIGGLAMRLEPETGPSIDNPDELQIAEALSDETNGFVILEDGSNRSFIQAARVDDKFILEYREPLIRETMAEPAGDRHFRVTEMLSLEQAARLMAMFSRRDASYKTAIGWQDVTAELTPRSRMASILILMIIALLAALAIYLYLMRASGG